MLIILNPRMNEYIQWNLRKIAKDNCFPQINTDRK